MREIGFLSTPNVPKPYRNGQTHAHGSRKQTQRRGGASKIKRPRCGDLRSHKMSRMRWKWKLTKSDPDWRSRVGRGANEVKGKPKASRGAHSGWNMCKYLWARFQYLRVHLGNLHTPPSRMPYTRRSRVNHKCLVGPAPRDRAPRSMNKWSRPLLNRSWQEANRGAPALKHDSKSAHCWSLSRERD